MKTVAWSELARGGMDAVKSGECLRVTGDGLLLGYFVVQPDGGMRQKIEALCSQIDAGKGVPAPL
tara:strand:+ start:416 stop:610 length:195 start_codon:yes stop_codon:yes gene_type:complete